MNRKAFFKEVREELFNNYLLQNQVDGINAILDVWDSRTDMDDIRWLAYMLATTKWETANTMQPIEEYGRGRGHAYGIVDPSTGKAYYGRGYVQLTWKINYKNMSGLVGVDLVTNPEKALDPKIAALIMFDGMKGGLFTGVGLPKYFNDTRDDPVQARKIINGTDHAEEIAEIHKRFLGAIEGAL